MAPKSSVPTLLQIKLRVPVLLVYPKSRYLPSVMGFGVPKQPHRIELQASGT